MPTPELSTIIILSEIVIIESVIIISLLVYLFFKSKNKSIKLNSLLKSFIDDEENRLKYLFSIFNKPEYLNEEKYNLSLKKIIYEENEFYKFIVYILYKNDLKRLSSFSEEMQKITYPCAELIANNKKENMDESIKIEPEVNAEDILDELLSNDTKEKENNVENDPAFDLSDSPDAEILVESTTEKEAIEEIPSDLLNNNFPEQSLDKKIDGNNHNSDNSVNTDKTKTE